MKIVGLFALLLTLVSSTGVRAQLVADGQTNVLDGVVTNVSGGVTIGTNGAFTLLIVTNGAAVTNSSGGLVIGLNAPAQSNRVAVTGTGSSLNCPSGSIVAGQNGPANELDILKGGLVTSSGGTVGSTSSSNLVLISDAGSLWQVASTINVGAGSSGGNNQVILTNGGMIISGTVQIGPNFASNNAAWVTGPGSVWTNSGNFSVGGYARSLLVVSNGGKVFSGSSSVGQGSFNTRSMAVITGAGSSWTSGYFYLGYITAGMHQLIINNGGAFNTSSTCDIGVYANSNILTVADAGSSLQCQTFRIGYSSTSNQCIVSNGATLTVTLSSQPTTIEGTLTVATVTGAGSVWTNAGDLDFGQYTNTLFITGGGTMVDNNGYIGGNSTKSNTVIVAGANSLWKNLGDLHLAEAGAQLIITNGGTVADNYGYFGDNTGNNNCVVLVSGAGAVWTNRYDLYVGNNSSSNLLTVAGSGAVFAQDIYLGNTTSSTNNSIILNGGQLVATNFNSSAINGLRGTLTLNSGQVTCNTLLFNNGTSGKLVFNGGTLQIRNSTVNNGLPLVVGDGTDAATLMLTTAGTSGGTHTFSKGLVISSNALFTGAGTVSGNVSVGSGGAFAPGTTNNYGLTINSGLVLSNGSTTVIGLNALSVSAHSAQGLTNVVYGGTLQLTNLGGSYAPGQSYKLFYSTHYSGAFTNVVPSSPGSGLRWDTSELVIDGVLRVFFASVPPPVLEKNVQISGGNLILNAMAGTPYDPVYLLTSTDLASPVSSWTCCATNYFDVSGTASITNAIAPGEPQRYFRLQLK